MNQMKKVPARKGEPKTYSYTFALPQLVGLGAGLAVALTVFFVLGILIGRGYRPEAEVPELARIMPVPVPANATAPEPQVLKPEELHYMEQLTQTSGAAKGQKAEAP
ncbi:MAG TPA: SPOR domain-containing protein, partial [Desulfovibrio sp.]|nr:SPOR domain-containing protein [Desulfovibrio sp.]